jgi:predicted transcriptional regulator
LAVRRSVASNAVDVTAIANTTLKERQSFILAEGSTSMRDANQHILALSAQIVAAHAGNNQIGIDVLPNMIRNVYNTLLALGPFGIQASVADGLAYSDHQDVAHDRAEHSNGHVHNVYEHPTFGQTVFNDRLICMEDGLSMKMLKRHLLTVHGMTPDQYRAKWGLPENYPMVAAEYAKLRSSLALLSGLGLKPEDRPSKRRKTRRG